MKKYYGYILILLFSIIVIVLFKTMNTENDTLKIEVIELSYDEKKELIKLGILSNTEYYIYSLKDIYFIQEKKKESLYEVLVKGTITIDEILKEMTLSDNCGGFIYSYDGEGKFGSVKFSILKGENKYVFTSYNPDLSDEIFDEYCNLISNWKKVIHE